MSENFALVLEGLGDGSGETLRRIKGALLGELGLSVSEAQTALGALPATLRRATTSAELDTWHTILSRAGAQVMIIQPLTGTSVTLSSEDIERASPLGAPPQRDSARHTNTAIIESGLDFTLQPEQARPLSPPAPVPTCSEIEFSLELCPPAPTLELKEDLVPATAELIDDLVQSPQPLEPRTRHTEAPLSHVHGVDADPPTNVVPTAPDNAEPGLASGPVEGKKSPLHGVAVETPSHVPLGRLTVGAPDPKQPPQDLRPVSPDTATIGARTHDVILTPELVITIALGTIVLALINWLFILP